MDDKSTKNIPQNEIDALARLLLPKIQEYFDAEAVQEELRRWKESKMEEKITGKKEVWSYDYTSFFSCHSAAALCISTKNSAIRKKKSEHISHREE